MVYLQRWPAWLVSRETAALTARSVYTIQPCSMSLHAKPHTYGARVFSCNLHVTSILHIQSYQPIACTLLPAYCMYNGTNRMHVQWYHQNACTMVLSECMYNGTNRFRQQGREEDRGQVPDWSWQGGQFQLRQESVLQSQVSVSTLISVSLPPLCYRSRHTDNCVLTPSQP